MIPPSYEAAAVAQIPLIHVAQPCRLFVSDTNTSLKKQHLGA